MYTQIIEKLTRDARVLEVTAKKQRKVLVWLALAIASVYLVAILLCLAVEAEAPLFITALALVTAAAAVSVCVFVRLAKKPKIFIGKITRIETERKIVAQKGTGAFGRLPMRTAEVYELVIAIENEKKETRVIFCPAQHEAVLKVGDTLLTHTALPYPAHLSNPTKCICMHCGTMQSAENERCITCGADLYTLFSVKK